MLSPRYLEGISDDLVEIYAQLEADILQDMARRVARLGKVTDATKWQAQLLAETGALKKDVQRMLQQYDPLVQDELNAIYNDAMIKNARADNKVFSDATGRTVSDINAQIMLASIQKTRADLSRLTITTAYTTEQQFIRQANAAYMQVTTGAFDYDTAMRNACDNLAKQGITSVQYRNGRPVTLSIEAAVRMNILTGVNQTASAITLNNCEELGCDLVETTAHIGARPSHEDWQGQVFSLSGSNPKYRPFSVCGLGTVDGLCGINCRHSYYPFFEGMERHYTQDDLDKMAAEKYTVDGKTYTRYEAEQHLRSMERNVRYYKREALTQQAGGVDNTKARRKIGEWQQKIKRFTDETKLERDRTREFIGTAAGKQPRGIVSDKLKANTDTKGATRPKQQRYKTLSNDETEKLKDALLDNGKKSEILQTLENRSVYTRKEVRAFKKPLNEKQIIERLADYDNDGHCNTLGLAYAANKAGYNVLNYKDGPISEYFANKEKHVLLLQLKGVKGKYIYTKSDSKAFLELIKEIKKDREYLLSIGNHSAIVRYNSDGFLEYLELQNYKERGWYILNINSADTRFDFNDYVDLERMSTIIDIETLAKNKDFIKITEYFNTAD